MMLESKKLFVLVLSSIILCQFVNGLDSNEIFDENIKNHRIPSKVVVSNNQKKNAYLLNDESGLTVVKPVQIQTTLRLPTTTKSPPQFQQTRPFKPSEVDDSPYLQSELPVPVPFNRQEKPQILAQAQPVSSQTAPKPIFTRSLGESGETSQPSDSSEVYQPAAQSYYNNNNNGRILPGLGWNIGGGGGGYGSGNLPCTTCNSIQSGYSPLPNSCCTHGFSTCCYVGVKPLLHHRPHHTHHQSHLPPHYPITTLTPSILHNTKYKFNNFNGGGYQSKPSPPLYHHKFGGGGGGIGGIGYHNSINSQLSLGGGGLFGGKKFGYNTQKPGTCYRPFGSGFGSGGGGFGYNNGANNAGYYYQRSDNNNGVDVRVAREDYPSQSYGISSSIGSGYGVPSSSYGVGTGGGFGGYNNNNNYNTFGGGHGGIIYPTTPRPAYCRRDYDCPGNQKCCTGYCSTPSFVG